MMDQFLKVTIPCPANLVDILIAEMSEIGLIQREGILDLRRLLAPRHCLQFTDSPGLGL